MEKVKCKICDTDRVEEETTGGKIVRRLEQNMQGYLSMRCPCKDCIAWAEEQYDKN